MTIVRIKNPPSQQDIDMINEVAREIEELHNNEKFRAGLFDDFNANRRWLEILGEKLNEKYPGKFMTHSFNGALIDEIEENGLDVSKEMFKKEYDEFFWDMYGGGKGNLCVTPLDIDTFVFTYDVPERFFKSVLKNSYREIPQGYKTVECFYKEKFDEVMKDAVANPKPFYRDFAKNKLEEIRQAGMRMIEFYTKSKEAGIAIIPTSILESDNPSVIDDKGTSFGHRIQGGKIPREYFAVARIPQIDYLTEQIIAEKSINQKSNSPEITLSE